VFALNRLGLEEMASMSLREITDLGLKPREAEHLFNALSSTHQQPATQDGGGLAEEDEGGAGGLGKGQAPDWGVCYGASGPAGKGQRAGWIDVKLGVGGKAGGWERVYAKRARNTLVLFR
jgi:hypothetical protein